jgi:competence protein ComGC
MKKLKNKKGITLIALVITIVVLLILAGVTIAMLTGDNGILTKAQSAKTQNDKASVKEKIELAVQASRINTDVSIDRSVLETELLNYKMEITKGENDEFPWTVKKDGYVFTISGTGEVKEKVGIAITTGDIEILSGSTEGKTLTAQLLNGETGTIEWSCEGNIAISETTGETTTLTLGNNASAGDTATITAEIKGKNQKDSINVKVVAQTTGLTIGTVTLGVNETETIEKFLTVNPENAESVEITGYSVTSGEGYASVDSTGKVTGNAIGSATITVTARGKLSGVEVSGVCTVNVEKKLISVTAQQIAADPKAYYGKKVENYKASDGDTKTYRIFYVDTENYFGDGENTIYLRADVADVFESVHLNYDFSSIGYDSENTKIRTMNPEWAKHRGNSEKDSDGNVTWNINERAAAYLCSPVNEMTYETTPVRWKECYNSNKANYVIGGPSVEMYVKSYNQAHDVGSDSLVYSFDESKLGYDFGGASLIYDSMYCMHTRSGQVWLGSPSISGGSNVCVIDRKLCGMCILWIHRYSRGRSSRFSETWFSTRS